MNLAVLSVAALVFAIIVSCVTSLNVGVLSLALAWIVGVYVGHMPINTVIAGFPTPLFLTLVGMTLLFSLAQCNGTLDKLAHHAVHACRGNRGAVPIMFFVLAAGLASIGPGNIATAALVAPMAMSTAARAGIPLFLMAIMVGNGSNAGALSPFAPTGIIVNGLMSRMGMGGFQTQTYVTNLLAHAAVAFAGYFMFGGLKLFGSKGPAHVVENAISSLPETSADTPFTVKQWTTLAVIAALVLGVMFFEINVGFGAFVGAVILVLTKCADDGEAIKRMPWRVIVMVTGVTVLISILEKAEGIDLLVSLIAKVATAKTVTGVVAFITGAVSVYSSTSGVVLPAFLPMVPGLAQQLGVTHPLSIANDIGGHLVDVSPLSTIGALCIAGSPAEDSRPLFNKLMAWGMSMTIVGAIVCYILF
jgi:Na+/H+ antiporter NhaD/arsenite permease-like protein